MAARKPGRNALLFIFITVLINMIGFGVIIPVMPDLVMDVTGQGRAEAARWGGLLSMSYAVMQFFMMPVIGSLSDRFGRRPVILLSLLAYSLDFLMMALAPTLGLLFVARLFAGAFSASFSTANAYIADITPPEKRAANFGLMGAAFGLGFIIGPGVGGVIGDELGHRAPFFLVAGLGFINLVYGFIFLPETLADENRRRFEWRRANAFGAFQNFRKYPVILPIAVVIFIAQLAHWTFPSVWAYYSGFKFDWSEKQIGFSLMAVGLASAIVQGGLTRIVIPKFGERKAAFFGIIIASFSYLGYGLASEGWMIYPLIAFGSLAGFTAPALQGIMSRTVPADAQGQLQGAIASINGVSMIIGPFMMTQIFAAFSEDGARVIFPGAPFIVAACLSVSALIPFLAAIGRIQRPRKITPTAA
ncbi:MAG: TCR/Tet family MFS transporter [Parvularculaceae bacterium]|nr:TCR/Tet family MFS transporter [Parvularculaceae bacterium]